MTENERYALLCANATVLSALTKKESAICKKLNTAVRRYQKLLVKFYGKQTDGSWFASQCTSAGVPFADWCTMHTLETKIFALLKEREINAREQESLGVRICFRNPFTGDKLPKEVGDAFLR